MPGNAPVFRVPFRFRFSLLILMSTVHCAAALFADSGVLAQNAANLPSRKFAHEPPALPLTDFYSAPDPLPAGAPGELIRSEPSYQYRLCCEVSVVRILYHSRSPNGQDVAVSGVVLLPEKTPPPGGWPIIAWAHEFTGAARQCAPSLVTNLNDGPLLSMYVGLGFAVVASDYAGLGTDFPHAALDMRGNALDVLYAIPAARAALSQLGSKWLVAGYSQGGLVAVGVAEAASQPVDPNYLGAIAISGVADPRDIFLRLVGSPSYYNLVFLAKGISAVFPKFRPQDMLTADAMPLFQYLRQACDTSTGPSVRVDRILQPGWENNHYVQEFFVRNTPGLKPSAAPFLIISGDADPDVPSTLTAAAVAQLCHRKDRVVFVQYPGLNASSVLGNSVSEQVSWIHARFAGRPAPSNCP
jgi:pimeloyl-ACP methyl ester carboxylesterase